MHGLRDLGHEAEISENTLRRGTQHIFFGAHMLPPAAYLPPDSVLYNLEQVKDGFIGNVDTLAQRCMLWDYSVVNVAEWKKKGLTALHVPIGYSPELTRITTHLPKDIDVLFYGSLNDRRAKILDKLRAAGLKVCARINDAYGEVLDGLIARAKVILNVHYYASRIFEIVRVGYALANKKAVVSEESADDYPELRMGIRIVPYAELVNVCEHLVADKSLRQELARDGFEAFSRMKESDYLKAALGSQVLA